jgi:long-chain acyl-CoA synthetase
MPRLSDAEVVEQSERARRGMLLAWWARRQPDVKAIVAPAGVRTFDVLNARANQAVRALRRLGLRAGDGVALLCTNRAEFAEVGAACQRAGWRLTTINWHLTAGEAGYILDDCEARALVADVSLASVATGAWHHAPGCEVALAVGGDIAEGAGGRPVRVPQGREQDRVHLPG